MSRLDRFLLYEEWCGRWPNTIQRALMRGISDHCPILLFMEEENWDPRPRRMLKFWADLLGYKQFVSDNFHSYQVNGWGGYVLKEKLKLVKGSLHNWHQRHTRNIESRISNLQERISSLDAKGEEYDLELEEVKELHSLSDNLHSLTLINTSMRWQKSRLLWLKEGDVNSMFFHDIMSSRRRTNSIVSLSVNGTVVYGGADVRSLVFNHFSSHFRSVDVERPSVSNLDFKMLKLGQCGELIKPFTVEEVKQAILDCDSFKSPGPEGSTLALLRAFGRN